MKGILFLHIDVNIKCIQYGWEEHIMMWSKMGMMSIIELVFQEINFVMNSMTLEYIFEIYVVIKLIDSFEYIYVIFSTISVII